MEKSSGDKKKAALCSTSFIAGVLSLKGLPRRARVSQSSRGHGTGPDRRAVRERPLQRETKRCRAACAGEVQFRICMP